MAVVVMAAQARHANTYCILCSTYEAVLALRIILEAEHEPSQYLGLHIRQLHWPYTLDNVASRRAETATLTYVKSRFQGYGQGPARAMA